jgi:hypothetical protein
MIVIEPAINGLIVTHKEGDREVIEGEGATLAAKLARSLVDSLGLAGSRHDKERVYVLVAPGDKHEDSEDKPCPFCLRK